jgi:hypothetical protein
MRDLIITKAPKRDCFIVNGITDKKFKYFIASWYTIILSNGDVCDKYWFVYQTLFILVTKLLFLIL